jgi:osmotically inducible lipoprotein OsmB
MEEETIQTYARLTLAGLASLLLFGACGDTRLQRTVTGAAGGAVAGEVIADEPLAGAGVGAAAGALRP